MSQHLETTNSIKSIMFLTEIRHFQGGCWLKGPLVWNTPVMTYGTWLSPPAHPRFIRFPPESHPTNPQITRRVSWILYSSTFVLKGRRINIRSIHRNNSFWDDLKHFPNFTEKPSKAACPRCHLCTWSKAVYGDKGRNNGAPWDLRR